MILIPNVWTAYRSVTNKAVGYNVILSRHVLDIHCYHCGDPICYRHAYPDPADLRHGVGVFRVVRTTAYELQRLMRDESEKLAEYLIPRIDYEELERLLGKSRKEW